MAARTKKEAPPKPGRRVVTRSGRKTSHMALVVNGMTVDEWEEPRLLDVGVGKKPDKHAAVIDLGLHPASGCKLASDGTTCGDCAHFVISLPHKGGFKAPGTGYDSVGRKVCHWAGAKRTCQAGQPACVQWVERGTDDE